MSHPTFVGMPPFPTTAREALADTQQRANLARATTTIRDKRLRHMKKTRKEWKIS